MTTSAPCSSTCQSPSFSASHFTTRHGAVWVLRLRTISSSPRSWNARARIVPTCPVPPGITILICPDRKLARPVTDVRQTISDRQSHFGNRQATCYLDRVGFFTSEIFLSSQRYFTCFGMLGQQSGSFLANTSRSTRIMPSFTEDSFFAIPGSSNDAAGLYPAAVLEKTVSVLLE